VSPANAQFFVGLLPVLAVGLLAGWRLAMQHEAKRRADRVVGGVRELYP
jgi:hypothetical protein